MPYKRVLDLAVVFYCLIEQRKGVSATALIHNEHLRIWNVTEDEIYNDALKNTPVLLAGSIVPMSKILRLQEQLRLIMTRKCVNTQAKTFYMCLPILQG